MVESIPREESVGTGADINGHVSKGFRGDEHLMRGFLSRKRTMKDKWLGILQKNGGGCGE